MGLDDFFGDFLFFDFLALPNKSQPRLAWSPIGDRFGPAQIGQIFGKKTEPQGKPEKLFSFVHALVL